MDDPRTALVDSVRADLPGALIALDFDGTLAPIVADPTRSRPVPGTVEALHRLTAAGARVALVTGRDAATVVRLGGFADVPGLVVEGLYGVEQWQDGTVTSPDTPPAMAALQRELPQLVDRHATDPAVWIEDKRLSLVVHGRLTADPEGVLDPLRDPVRDLAARLDLEYHQGKGVLELRLPGYDKGAALRRLVGRFTPSRVLYAGDDVGDLPAFEAVRALRSQRLPAWTVASSGADTPPPPELVALADLVVAGPDELVGLLAALA